MSKFAYEYELEFVEIFGNDLYWNWVREYNKRDEFPRIILLDVYSNLVIRESFYDSKEFDRLVLRVSGLSRKEF